MYCVIQKVCKKKPNTYGTAKELKVTHSDIFERTRYGYSFSDEKFERCIKESFKISIHHSYREDGKVKKKQWHITTVDYYDLIDFCFEDCYNSRLLQSKLEEMGLTEQKMCDLVYEKLDPIIHKIKKEFNKSPEGKVKQEHEQILEKYRKVKHAFESIYGSDTYDYCFDIYDNLRNKAYLHQLEEKKKKEEEYEKRSYSNRNQSNYNSYSSSDYSSYFTNKSSTYNDDEKKLLKKIYREASKKFHPDVAGDDGTMMKFLTKLKEQWGI